MTTRYPILREYNIEISRDECGITALTIISCDWSYSVSYVINTSRIPNEKERSDGICQVQSNTGV